MNIKKSLIKAENEAKELSLKNSNTRYYVLDRKNKSACCLSVDFLVREKIAFENYYIYCTYINGIKKY